MLMLRFQSNVTLSRYESSSFYSNPALKAIMDDYTKDSRPEAISELYVVFIIIPCNTNFLFGMIMNLKFTVIFELLFRACLCSFKVV